MLLNKKSVDNKINTIHDLIKDKHPVSFSKPAVTGQKTL